ncbi:hypothetical protein INT45_003237 [Circinella minor]|uniref:Uncharacterized protein n=1 Tax=Circinella minor TaxID=1195481 RepID=A0A8H7VN36_9FUNG|nr:hypothetical protein INT45_003237 [Circinella minor]
MTFDRHAQHPYNYGQPYQPSQQQQTTQHPQQPPYSPPQDQQQQQQQQQPYLGAPLPWPPPSSGSGLVGTDINTYGQLIPSISSPTATTATTSTPTTNNTIPGTSSSTTTTCNTQQQEQIEVTKSTQEDPNKQYHPEWGVLREQDFHPLALKHQRDLENHFQNGTRIADFYFWQANLGGYCMADMNQNIVVSSEGVFVLVRRMVEGAPHPGRKKKKRGMD